MSEWVPSQRPDNTIVGYIFNKLKHIHIYVVISENNTFFVVVFDMLSYFLVPASIDPTSLSLPTIQNRIEPSEPPELNRPS